jgi:hypothetical protein
MKNTFRALILIALLPVLISCGGGSGTSALFGVIPGEASKTSNAIPIANAGITQNVKSGSTVTLDGTASRDANNESLTYLWQMVSKPAGSTAVLSSSTSPKPTFSADVTGIYNISLVVNDGKANSLLSTVIVNASFDNALPVAIAGASQNAILNSLVRLDGTLSSDDDLNFLTYRWSFLGMPTGSKPTLSNAASPIPTFTPDMVGSYIIQLIVNDGRSDSKPSAMTVTVSGANVPPTPDAGPDQNVTVGKLATLDGTNSKDRNDDFIKFRWNIVTRPIGSTTALSDLTSPKPTFTPDKAGIYVATLIVNDGKVDSEVDTVTINASVENSAPDVGVGPNQSVIVGDRVTLDGSSSKDTNNDPLTYTWTLLSRPVGSTAALSNPTIFNPSFTADLVGTYVAALMVKDGKENSVLKSTTVTASVLNAKPVAAATTTTPTVARTATVTLSGASSTDANVGDSLILKYTWALSTKPTASTATLSSASAASPTFVADLAGIYVATLRVNDGKEDSDNVATVVVTAN